MNTHRGPLPPLPHTKELIRCPRCSKFTRANLIRVKCTHPLLRPLHQLFPRLIHAHKANARICSHCRGIFEVNPDSATPRWVWLVLGAALTVAAAGMLWAHLLSVH